MSSDIPASPLLYAVYIISAAYAVYDYLLSFVAVGS